MLVCVCVCVHLCVLVPVCISVCEWAHELPLSLQPNKCLGFLSSLLNDYIKAAEKGIKGERGEWCQPGRERKREREKWRGGYGLADLSALFFLTFATLTAWSYTPVTPVVECHCILVHQSNLRYLWEIFLYINILTTVYLLNSYMIIL